MTESKNIRDVVIIGKGFAGLSLAIELVQSGAGRVEIVHDENDVFEASSAAHGISTVKGIFEADSDLFSKKIEGHRGFNDWLQSLEALVGIKRPPNVWLSGVSESFRTAEDFKKDFGRIYRKDFVGLKNVKVNFSAKDQFATAFYPADFWIDPNYLLDLLMTVSRRLGVVVTTGRVTKIHLAQGCSELALKSAKTIKARCVVICAGAGTAALVPRDGPEALRHLFAVAGCTFRAQDDQRESCEVKGTAGFISSGKNIYWGSTSESTQELSVNEAPAKPPNHSEQIIAGQKLLTKLGRHKISSADINTAWGVRVRTRKREPFVGCIDPIANVWASTGFYKSGITLCWLLSKSVSKKILESIKVSEHLVTSNR